MFTFEGREAFKESWVRLPRVVLSAVRPREGVYSEVEVVDYHATSLGHHAEDEKVLWVAIEIGDDFDHDVVGELGEDAVLLVVDVCGEEGVHGLFELG